MAKYVIVKHVDRTMGYIHYSAYRTIFGMWGWMTLIAGCAGSTIQECEDNLRHYLSRKNDSDQVVKEIKIK